MRTVAVSTSRSKGYITQSGTLTFAPGETSKTVIVQIVGDTTAEPNQTLKHAADRMREHGIGSVEQDVPHRLLLWRALVRDALVQGQPHALLAEVDLDRALLGQVVTRQQAAQLAEANATIAVLQRIVFGRSSEKSGPAPDGDGDGDDAGAGDGGGVDGLIG